MRLYRKIKKKITKIKYLIKFLLKLRFNFSTKEFYIQIGEFYFISSKFNFKKVFAWFYLLMSRNILQYNNALKEVYEKIHFSLDIKQVYFLLGCIESSEQNFAYCTRQWLFTYNRKTNKIFVVYLDSERIHVKHLFIPLSDDFKNKDIEEILDFVDKIISYSYKHFDDLLSENKKHNKNLDINRLKFFLL